MRSPISSLVVAAALGGVALAGCSSASDTAAEKITEAATGGDVEISENGDVSISTPDGNMSISEGGQELPADFPSDVPVPDGTIESLTTTNTAGSGPSFIFAVRLEGEVPAITEQLSTDFVAKGWTEQSKTTAADGAMLIYEMDDGRNVTVSLGEDMNNEGGIVAQYIVVAPAP